MNGTFRSLRIVLLDTRKHWLFNGEFLDYKDLKVGKYQNV